MSISYCLVCIDCGEAFHLGKTYKMQSRFHTEPSYGFGYHALAPEESERELVALQHFLLLHRQHELRVLPDDSAEVQDCWTWFTHEDCGDMSLECLVRCTIAQPLPGHKPSREAPIDPLVLKRLAENVVDIEDRQGFHEKRQQ